MFDVSNSSFNSEASDIFLDALNPTKSASRIHDAHANYPTIQTLNERRESKRRI